MAQKHRENSPLSILLDVLYDIAGGLMMAVGLQCFSAPNQIAPGGVNGIAILVNHLAGLPISLVSFGINIPLLILAWRFLGRRFTVRTLKSVIVVTLAIEAASYFPVYQGELILAALYGGVLTGAGLSLVFMRGSTTGGTDIVARLIQNKKPNLSVGRLLLVIDALVLLASAVVYRNVESALFALVSIFTRTRVLDSILYGLDKGKVLMIITELHEEVSRRIITELNRGCTLLEGRGTFTQADRPVLLCAVRSAQLYEVKQLVFDVDPAAFIMAMEANEIIGNGFKPSDAPPA